MSEPATCPINKFPEESDLTKPELKEAMDVEPLGPMLKTVEPEEEATVKTDWVKEGLPTTVSLELGVVVPIPTKAA